MSRVLGATRTVLVGAAVSGLLVTPPFALAYFSAYPVPGERPTAWLEAMREPLHAAGALSIGSTSIETYNLLGATYGLLLLTVAVCLMVLRPVDASRLLRRARASTAAALLVAGLGAVAEYGVNHPLAVYGFLVELVGLLLAVLASGVVAWAWARGRGHRHAVAWLCALVPTVVVVATTMAIGHLPSGPGAAFLLAALTWAAVGTWRARRPALRQLPAPHA